MVEPALRWVEPSGSQRPLAAVLRELGVAEAVLAAGAVFVNRQRRTLPDHLVAPQDVVEVYPVHLGAERCQVVEQRGDLLLVDKPAQLASEPTHLGGGGSVAEQLEASFGQPVHVHSRLDVGVSGLMLVLLSEAARKHVEQLRAQGSYHRHYVAVVGGAPAKAAGLWRAKLGKGHHARDAETRYRIVETASVSGSPSPLALLALAPITGRTHQLRIQCAQAGAPILGDKRYKGLQRLVSDDGSVHGLTRILLHAARVELTDLRGLPWHVVLPPPNEVTDLWTLVGGTAPAMLAACAQNLLADSSLD
jgi:23S rRNA-/tRNA-specific pseudouridylate synthase